ncbi:MAG: M13 family metallopeptidase, partial [Acidimicrobiales bacterium]
MKRVLGFLAVALAATLISLVPSAPAGQASQTKTPPAMQATRPSAGEQQHGLDASDIDHTCKPCEDFYRYVNGNWLSNPKNQIPAAYPAWGRVNLLDEHNREILHGILEEAAANKSAEPGSIEQKIGDFYASCVDTAKIDAAGIHPLDEELASIAKISDVASLEAEVAHLHGIGTHAMFAFGSTQDLRDSTEQTGEADQGGLGLPNRDYYTKDDDRSKKLRDGYRAHLSKMFGLMGDTMERSAAEAGIVMDIETKLAESSKSPVDLRDPEANYHRMSVSDLSAVTPHFDWPGYFREIGFPGIRVVNAAQPDFLKTLDGLITSVPIENWNVYLRWHLVHSAAPYLSAPFLNENFDFFGRTLTGTTEQVPRWKRCVAATDRDLGEALGQKYVARAFPPSAKARALEMVHNLIDALREDLKTLSWMSPETRLQAITKLNAITLKIGYPDKWRDYSGLRVDRGPYVLNNFRSAQFETRFDLNKIGKAVDKGEWGMTQPTVNAYYNPQLNEI